MAGVAGVVEAAAETVAEAVVEEVIGMGMAGMVLVVTATSMAEGMVASVAAGVAAGMTAEVAGVAGVVETVAEAVLEAVAEAVAEMAGMAGMGMVGMPMAGIEIVVVATAASMASAGRVGGGTPSVAHEEGKLKTGTAWTTGSAVGVVVDMLGKGRNTETGVRRGRAREAQETQENACAGAPCERERVASAWRARASVCVHECARRSRQNEDRLRNTPLALFPVTRCRDHPR